MRNIIKLEDAVVIITILTKSELVGEDHTITELIADECEVATNRILMANAWCESEEMFPNQDNDKPMGYVCRHP